MSSLMYFKRLLERINTNNKSAAVKEALMPSGLTGKNNNLFSSTSAVPGSGNILGRSNSPSNFIHPLRPLIGRDNSNLSGLPKIGPQQTGIQIPEIEDSPFSNRDTNLLALADAPAGGVRADAVTPPGGGEVGRGAPAGGAPAAAGMLLGGFHALPVIGAMGAGGGAPAEGWWRNLIGKAVAQGVVGAARGVADASGQALKDLTKLVGNMVVPAAGKAPAQPQAGAADIQLPDYYREYFTWVDDLKKIPLDTKNIPKDYYTEIFNGRRWDPDIFVPKGKDIKEYENFDYLKSPFNPNKKFEVKGFAEIKADQIGKDLEVSSLENKYDPRQLQANDIFAARLRHAWNWGRDDLQIQSQHGRIYGAGMVKIRNKQTNQEMAVLDPKSLALVWADIMLNQQLHNPQVNQELANMLKFSYDNFYKNFFNSEQDFAKFLSDYAYVFAAGWHKTREVLVKEHLRNPQRNNPQFREQMAYNVLLQDPDLRQRMLQILELNKQFHDAVRNNPQNLGNFKFQRNNNGQWTFAQAQPGGAQQGGAQQGGAFGPGHNRVFGLNVAGNLSVDRRGVDANLRGGANLGGRQIGGEVAADLRIGGK